MKLRHSKPLVSAPWHSYLSWIRTYQNSGVPTGLVERLRTASAAILGQPEDYVTPLSPACNCSSLPSRVEDTAGENCGHKAQFFKSLTKELDLGQDLIIICFSPLEPWQIDKKGTVMTFL
uniref:Uncharacterized protein n=1 Tax=Panthera leo TaxID=9689 RepID=A0A8C8WSV1_PANLE